MAPSHLPSPGLGLDSQQQQQGNQMTLQPRMQQQQQLGQGMVQKTLPPYPTPPLVGGGGQMGSNPIMVSSSGTANIPGIRFISLFRFFYLFVVFKYVKLKQTTFNDVFLQDGYPSKTSKVVQLNSFVYFLVLKCLFYLTQLQ
jgi:hypothetical protein